MKFSGLLNLRKKDIIDKVTVVSAGQSFMPGLKPEIRFRVVKANHDELVSRDYSIGLVMEISFDSQSRKIVLTSDTGLLPFEGNSDRPIIGSDYEHEVWKSYNEDNKETDVLVVHVGAIKEKELDESFKVPKDACYPNHLGIIGTARVITKVRPKLAIVSEFGEEMRAFRCSLIEGLKKEVVDKALKRDGKPGKDICIIPGDISFVYDLKTEKYCSCVNLKWKTYKNICFATDSDHDDLCNGVYYFDKMKRLSLNRSENSLSSILKRDEM